MLKLQDKKDILHLKIYNPKSKNFGGKNQDFPNDQRRKPSTDEYVVMTVQTCAFVFNGGKLSWQKYMLGSACTSRICTQHQYFKSYSERRSKILVWNKDVVTAEGFGSLRFQSTVNCIDCIIELRDVLYASNKMYNLISCSKAGQNGWKSDIDYSDYSPSNGLMRLIEKRNSLTRIVGMETQEDFYEASVKPLPVRN